MHSYTERSSSYRGKVAEYKANVEQLCSYLISQELQLKSTKEDGPGEHQAQGRKVEPQNKASQASHSPLLKGKANRSRGWSGANKSWPS